MEWAVEHLSEQVQSLVNKPALLPEEKSVPFRIIGKMLLDIMVYVQLAVLYGPCLLCHYRTLANACCLTTTAAPVPPKQLAIKPSIAFVARTQHAGRQSQTLGSLSTAAALSASTLARYGTRHPLLMSAQDSARRESDYGAFAVFALFSCSAFCFHRVCFCVLIICYFSSNQGCPTHTFTYSPFGQV